MLMVLMGVANPSQAVEAADEKDEGNPFSLTLKELQHAARRTHPGIQFSQLQQQAALQDVKATERQRWPQLSATVETHSSAVGSELMQVLRVNQTLWDGGNLSARIEAARAQEAVSGVNAHLEVQSVDLQLVDAWQKLLMARERKQIAQATLEKLQAYQQQMERRIQAQASPLIDLELVNARALQTEVDLVTAQEVMHVAVSQLEQLSGLTDLSRRLAHLPPVPSLAQTRHFALMLEQTDWHDVTDAQASVQRAQHEWEVAQHQFDAKSAERWPQAYFRVDQPLIKANALFGSTEPKLFLGMNYTPGAGFANWVEAEAMETRVQSLAQRIEAVRREVLLTLNNDAESFTSARKRLQALEKSVQGSEQVLASYSRQFQAGRKTWQDVLNALREQAQSQYNLADTSVAMTAAMYRLAVRLNLEPEILPNF